MAVYTENATGKACTVSVLVLFKNACVSGRNSRFLSDSPQTLRCRAAPFTSAVSPMTKFVCSGVRELCFGMMFLRKACL